MTTAAQRRKDADKLAAMQTEMADLDTTLATHYRAALNGGWTVKELESAGLDVPKTATRKRAPKPRQQTAASGAPVSDAASEAAAPAA